MKKRLIAVALAAVLVFNLGMQQRAQAEAATVAVGAGLAILAANLIGLMTGQYDETAEAIGIIIEEGVEGLQNAADQFGGLWMSGFNIILDSVTNMFDAGEISLDGTEFQLKYSQYLEMCGAVEEVITPTVELGTTLPYKLYSSPFSLLIDSRSLDYFLVDDKIQMSFMPVYYSEDTIYFSNWSYYQGLSVKSSGSIYAYSVGVKTSADFSKKLGSSSSGYPGGGSLEEGYANAAAKFVYDGAGTFTCISTVFSEKNYTVSNWLTFDGNSFTDTAAADLDTNGLNSGYLLCKGYAHDFLKTIEAYAANRQSHLDDLSEALDPVLDKTSDPSLLIDTNPAIVNPVDSVTVSDIPGEKDVNLSNLKEKTRTDLDMPSILAKKFPFCLPYDFIRIIGVLAAPAKAPVFRIPLSTDPAILEQFEGNETIGQLPEDFEPMFEIDEEIVIDLSHIPLIQPVCNTIFILGFVVLLIYLTPKMIQH